jgi:cytochrome c biogenesis protein
VTVETGSQPPVPSGVPIDDPVDREWEAGLEPRAVQRDREAAERRSAGGTGRPPRPTRTRSRMVASAALAWRQLTSMRTALMLLFLLAIAAVPGSLLPQRSVNPLRVQQYLQDHPSIGPFFDRLSGFNVFSAPWFSAIYVLLMVSLVGCVVPRLRLHLRTLLQPPPRAPAHPSRLPSGAAWTTSLPADEAVAAARSTLRRARFRVAIRPAAPDEAAGSGAAVSAEKGMLRETGNLLFHFSLIGMLVGVAVGSLFGYSGSVLIPEGRTFTNSLVAYDAFTPGARVDQSRLQPFSFTLRDFSATYRASGEPATFNAAVAFRPHLGAPAQDVDVRVNRPLTLGQTKVYLTGHGYAPHFVLRDRSGRILFDDYVPCTPRGGTEPARSSCTVKIPDAGLAPAGPLRVPQQLAFRASMLADPAGGTAELRNPQLELSAFVGDLHLDEGTPQNVYSLDPSGLNPVRTAGAGGQDQLIQAVDIGPGAGGRVTGLPDGLTLEVDGVHDWSVFAMKHDPGKELVLAAAVLLLLGLVLSLTVRRRRMWVRATPVDGESGRTLVEVGGVARTGDLSAEFEDLVARLRDRLPPAAATTEREPRVQTE